MNWDKLLLLIEEINTFHLNFSINFFSEIDSRMNLKKKQVRHVLDEEKNILKEKYPENAFSIHKLNDLKSFANEKVNEIISEDEFKALIYNLDKHNKLPNTSTEMENKYREKFYQLRLDIVSEEENTILLDDFQNPQYLMNKINKAYDLLKSSWHAYMSSEKMISIRQMFEEICKIALNDEVTFSFRSICEI